MKLSLRLYLLLAGVGSLVPESAFAQREVLYEQYVQNPMAINPAFTGVRQDFNMNVMLRRRWFLIRNAPITQTLSADGTVAGGRVGIGLMALNDRMSPFFTTGAYASAAYHWEPSVGWKVSLGVQGGVNVLPVYDFSSATSANRALGSAGAGVWVSHADRFFFGISKPELLSQGYGSDRQSLFRYRRPLFLYGGAALPAADKLVVTPSLLVVQEQGRPLRLDAGARLWYDQKIGFGLFYRGASVNYLQVSGEAQVTGNIRLGYIYNSRAIESTIIGVSNNPLSIHEIMFKYIPSPTAFHLN